MKIAVIGNSHVSALKLGLSEAVKSSKTIASADITFFAVPGHKFERFDVRDGKLMSDDTEVVRMIKRTSGGHNHIDPAGYDLFILHGLLLRFGYSMVRNRFYSAQVADLCLQELTGSSLSLSLYKKLLEITDRPVMLSPCPLRADNAPGTELFTSRFSNPAIDYDRFIRATQSHLERDIDRVIPQPVTSRTPNLTTKQEFSEGSARLLHPSEIHDDDDFSHMNSSYGTLWWCSFADHISELLVPAR